MTIVRRLLHRCCDALFDWRYGVDTQGKITPGALDAIGPHKWNSSGYEAVHVATLRRMLNRLKVDKAQYMFADYGSGKGRAVMMAAMCSFRGVVGVELSPRLHKIAQRNVAALEKRRRGLAPIDLICTDAIRWQIPDHDMVIFLYNPFDSVVMRKVVSAMEAWRSRHPHRKLVVMYRNPQSALALEESRYFKVVFADEDFRIYETIDAPDSDSNDDLKTDGIET